MHWITVGLVALSVMAPAAGQAETILRLAETATILVHPDELSASLRTEATAGTAAEAQNRVNTAIAAAIARAKAVPGVAIATGGYNVWHVAPTPQDRTEHWQATQSLELKGPDAATVLALTGELQRAGLATNRLSWGLSPDALTKARTEATRQALTALRGRAEAAAALIGLSFDSFREVRLDSVRPIAAAPRMMAAAMRDTVAPPSAEAEDIPVAATAEADVLLKAP
jgi:predicted secreted protein